VLKGYRAPLAAVLVALLLLGLVVISRPVDQPIPAANAIIVSATPIPSQAGATNPILTTVPPTSVPVATVSSAPTVPNAVSMPVDPTTLKEALIGSPKKLNPLLAGYNPLDRDISSLIFEGLFTTDAYGASVPDLAAAPPDVSNDGLGYAVTLRSDVTWQDGVPFTADDVLFTIHLMQSTDFPGAKDLQAFWQSVEVDALDAHTVRFRLAQPLASFPEALRIGLLPEHALRGVTAAQLATQPFNVSPIGTGPYQFDGWLGGADGTGLLGIKLKLAATYRQRPEGKTGYALQHLVFRFYPTLDAALSAYQNGDVSSVSGLPANTNVSTAFRLYFQYQPAFGAVIYNWQSPSTLFFRNLQFRQALARSVNRDVLVSHYLAGRALPASSPILPDSWAYAPDVNCALANPYNLDSAKGVLAIAQSQKLLVTAAPATAAATAAATAPASAPTTAGAGNGAFGFRLLVNNDPALVGMGQDIVKAWASIGLSVQIIVTDSATFNARLVKGDFDAALVELNLAPSADPDPYTLWRQPPSEGGLNFGGMNDRRLNDLVEQARRESSNGVQRAALYHDYQKVFCDEAAALLLYDPVYVYGADTRLTGVQLGFIAEPSDRFRTIQNWQFVP
jgi:peptide/nickel transport system substrate-binding protein